MSANTSIKEGGMPFPFGPVKALLVEGSDGKYYPWVPESERQLGYKSIDKNGIYRSSDDGVYGWGSVSVSVSQATSVTGRDPDTGEEVVVRPDPETGDIVKTVVPVEIRVIEPPTNPYGTYVDGETIITDGMVVKAYGANGDEMQIVPIGEITINPTTAVFDESKDTGGGTAATISDSALYNPNGITQPVSAVNVITETTLNPKQTITYTPYGNAYLFLLDNGRSTVIAAVATTPESGYREQCINETDPTRSYDVIRSVLSVSNTTRVSHTPFGIIYGGSADKSYAGRVRKGVPTHVSTPWNSNEFDRDLATIIIDGNRTDFPAGSPQTITVSWPRPGDGAILETTFDILVGPHGGQGDD